MVENSRHFYLTGLVCFFYGTLVVAWWKEVVCLGMLERWAKFFSYSEVCIKGGKHCSLGEASDVTTNTGKLP